jgi:NADPH:quinone reductase-like Zn-dependent oxidoreductase
MHMKAVVRNRYGSPGVLQLREVPVPTPKDEEVLVKVHASSLNASDLEALRGVFLVRIGAPLRPKHKILGSDIAGRVEAVGRNVKQYQPGDEVWADLFECGCGAFAEYVSVPESVLAPKPDSMAFEEAATYPQAAVLALQNLQGVGSAPGFAIAKEPVQPGQKVLINGAGGGVGTFTVQLAKHFGAEVTGVDSGQKLDMLRTIGADHVIDYTREDFTETGQRYDLILDLVARRSIKAYRRALSPDGTFLYVGGSAAVLLGTLLRGTVDSGDGTQKMGIVMPEPNRKEDLAALAELFEAGKVVPVIDRRYPLSDIPEAFRYLESGRVLGKIVISVAPDDQG